MSGFYAVWGAIVGDADGRPGCEEALFHSVDGDLTWDK